MSSEGGCGGNVQTYYILKSTDEIFKKEEWQPAFIGVEISFKEQQSKVLLPFYQARNHVWVNISDLPWKDWQKFLKKAKEAKKK